MVETDKNCTVLIAYDKGVPPSQNELQKQLENGKPKEKLEALKTLVLLMLNGELFPKMLMVIIRHVVREEDHRIKKILMLYWEIVEKLTADGKLREEMILVCNALRQDLLHPNEYIRGCTLRLLCRLKYTGILDPLIPAILQNLEHRHSYVRRNAVMCIYAICRSFGTDVIPDAPEKIQALLDTETDLSTKRNAFLMLFHCDQERAINYLVNVSDQVSTLGDIFQLVVLELIRKVCRADPSQKGRFMKIIFSLTSSPSTAVAYECASSLIALSSAPTAVRAATAGFVQLLVDQSDNNVKLIVLDRLTEMKKQHSKHLQERLMDILRALSSPSADIRRKCLDLTLELLSPRNIEEVVQLLKKEVQKTQSQDQDKPAQEYRQMLIQTIHACAVRYPEIANNVVHLLMDFLGDASSGSAVDVILFVREIVESYPKLREQMLEKLRDCFGEIKSSRVYRVALWILGEYSDTPQDIQSSVEVIRNSLGALPLLPVVDDAEDKKHASKADTTEQKLKTRTIVLADGTYATQTELTATPTAGPTAGSGPLTTGSSLRSLLLGGEFYVASVSAVCLTKLVIKSWAAGFAGANALAVDVLMMLLAILKLGRSNITPYPIDQDSYDRIVQCVKILGTPNDQKKAQWLLDGRASLGRMLSEQKQDRETDEEAEDKVARQPDDLIQIRQLRGKKAIGEIDFVDEDESDLMRATGSLNEREDFSARLNRVFQMTGLSDPVYVEAYLQVHHYDIVLEMLVINRTSDTLQNLTIELATHGDLRIVERPQSYTFGPFDTKTIKASIKVSSTEAGIIFGNATYDLSASTDRAAVILNDIHIDIMDYITPAVCTDTAFRSMWAEFEWENKVAVSTSMSEVKDFLNHIVKSTNMKCLSPPSALEGECGFLAANLYAKSIFGEDALVNLSIEKQADGKIGGYIRIRSKTQGIALSLGDRITLMQKGPQM
eukprot:GILJ01002543.1.p1 GENE.GILJ01002543.1~~GILJ01002543.1.p1  ORF type:complete len:968 (-),score=162.96 GILJ01002543.1:186-3032(-)